MIQGKNTVRSAAQDFLEIKGYTEVLHWISKDSIYEKFATTCRSSPQSYIFSPVVKWEKLQHNKNYTGYKNDENNLEVLSKISLIFIIFHNQHNGKQKTPQANKMQNKAEVPTKYSFCTSTRHHKHPIQQYQVHHGKL